MGIDQFYTKETVSLKYWNIFKTYSNNYDIILEPSAGSGSFFKLLPEDKRIGLDLEPKYPDIITQNFFDFTPIPNKIYHVIGNPPFGKGSSLAVKFFNHAAEFADIIAFIIPRTFKRVSVQNKLNMSFSLVFSEDLSTNPCCFEPKMDAKCCFQIWKKEEIPRKKIICNTTHDDFVFVKYGPLDHKKQPTVPDLKTFDFAIRAYGSDCGKIFTENLEKLRPKSYHFIKSNLDIDVLIERFKTLDYSISNDSVRQCSLGKSDLIHLYNTACVCI